MKRFTEFGVLLGLVLSSGLQAQDGVAPGSWRIDWSDGRVGQVCLSDRFTPWRTLPYAPIGCDVKEVKWREANGTTLSLSQRSVRRDFFKAGAYWSEFVCESEGRSSAHADGPVTSNRSTITRVWKGDFVSRLEFSETDDSGVVWEQFTMSLLGTCGESMSAGRKCRIPTANSPASSEWPACDSALMGKSSP
jgi:hypothetical protein